MAFASPSAARFSNAALGDPLAGFEPANDAYGSLAGLATRPKPKKKPVLVLDAAELAEAHALFQLGAAEQLEDADQIERRPVMLGLAPIGSDVAPDNTPDADEDEYSVEADAPAPEEVLKLTRAEPATLDAAPRSFKKSMVVLPPDGDPALEAIEPFAPMEAVDEEEVWPEDLWPEDVSPEEAAPEEAAEQEAATEEPVAEEPVAESPVADEPVAGELLLDPAMIEELTWEEVAEPVAESLPEAEEPAARLPLELELTFELEELPPDEHAPAEGLAPRLYLEPPPKPPLAPEIEPEAEFEFETEAEAEILAQEQVDGSITRMEEDEIDGLAFMRGPERRKISISDVPPTSHNTLRARLVREEDMVVEEYNPTAWARFTAWLADAWRRFLG